MAGWVPRSPLYSSRRQALIKSGGLLFFVPAASWSGIPNRAPADSGEGSSPGIAGRERAPARPPGTDGRGPELTGHAAGPGADGYRETEPAGGPLSGAPERAARSASPIGPGIMPNMARSASPSARGAMLHEERQQFRVLRHHQHFERGGASFGLEIRVGAAVEEHPGELQLGRRVSGGGLSGTGQEAALHRSADQPGQRSCPVRDGPGVDIRTGLEQTPPCGNGGRAGRPHERCLALPVGNIRGRSGGEEQVHHLEVTRGGGLVERPMPVFRFLGVGRGRPGRGSRAPAPRPRSAPRGRAGPPECLRRRRSSPPASPRPPELP